MQSVHLKDGWDHQSKGPDPGGMSSRRPEASRLMDVWNVTSSSFASRMAWKVFSFSFPLLWEKIYKTLKKSVIKNDGSGLGLTEQKQPVIGVLITHLHVPQIPTMARDIQGCSGSQCPPLPWLRDGFHLPCPQGGGATRVSLQHTSAWELKRVNYTWTFVLWSGLTEKLQV